MPYSIRKVGSKYCLYLKDSGKRLGCHATKAGAESQRRAIEMRKHASHRAASTAVETFVDEQGVPHLINVERLLDAYPVAEGVVEIHLNDKTFLRVKGNLADIQSKMQTSMKAASRNLLLRGAAGTEIRTAQFDGKERVVVSVVGLVEGVIWPINAEGPEYVPAETISMIPQGWNGRPVFAAIGHPVNEEGEQVSGNTPQKLEDAIGTVFNARTDGKRLLMEAWLDPTKPEAQTVLARVNSGQPIEVSVGAFVIEEHSKGMFEGKRYDAIWREIIPDHLALLPEGDEGACSVAMGCGIRAAKVHTLSAEGGVSYPQQGPEEYRAMMESLGAEYLQAHMFTHCMDVIIPAIKAKGGSVDDPNAFCGWWKQENSMANPKAMSAFTGHVKALVDQADPLKEVQAFGDGTVVYETAAGKMYRQSYTVADGKLTLGQDRVEVEPVMYYEPVDVKVAKGARHSAADMAKIQAMHDYAMELGASCGGSAYPKAAATHPCGCQDKETEMAKRTKEQREELVKALRAKVCPKIVTRLEAAAKGSGDLIDAIIAGIKDKLKLSDAAAADLANLDESTLVELAGMAAPEAPAEPPAENKDGSNTPPVPPTAAQAKTPQTEDEFLAAAPESIRNLVADAKAKEAARKTDLIKVLKGAQTEYTEAELKEKPVKELERLVRACKANVPPVDFGVNAPKGDENKDEAPAPIDVEGRIKAAKAKK